MPPRKALWRGIAIKPSRQTPHMELFMRIVGLAALFVVAGCAPAYSWHHEGLDGGVAERQLQIDGAECQAYAMQTIPLPNTPAPQSTTTVNVYNGYNGTANYGAGTYDPRSTQEGANFIESLNRQKLTQDAVRARANLADACMMKRGWVRE